MLIKFEKYIIGVYLFTKYYKNNQFYKPKYQPNKMVVTNEDYLSYINCLYLRSLVTHDNFP